jgi:hypothetical protein
MTSPIVSWPREPSTNHPPPAGEGRGEGERPLSPKRLASTLIFLIALLALLAQFAVYVDYAASLFRFPYDYDQGEGFELYDTVLHAQGQWPYRDSQVFPFYTSIYPPLFHVITVPLVWAFGPQLWTGRLVSFTASLVAAGAIASGVTRAGGSRAIGVLSGLTFLASNDVFHIGPLFRQHMTMVTFETLAIVCLAQLDFQPETPWRRRPAFWLGLLFLLAAGFTKQLALATVVAGLVFLFVRGPRRALLAGLGLAVVAGAIFLLLNRATSGYWYLSIIRANINAFDWAQASQLYRQWTGLHWLIVAVALARLAYETYVGRLSAYGIWFGLAVADSALSGKFGAGESYFVTATAAVCALSGIALARLWARSRAWHSGEGAQPRYGAAAAALGAATLAVAIPLLYLAQTRLTLHLPTTGPIYGPAARALGVSSDSGYYDSQGYTQLGPPPTAADVAAGDAIAALARAAAGPVFSEEAGFMFRAGKPVVTNPFPQLVMYQAGLFDPANEIAMIRQQAFGLVILRAQFYPPPVLQALGANYKPTTEINMNRFLYRILEPRGTK